MVGPWLFWLGPMTFFHALFALLPLAWHCFLASFCWHCVGFFMMVIGGVLATILGFLGELEGGEDLDTLWISGWFGHDDEFIRRLSLCEFSLAGRTHCMLSAPM